MPTLSAGSDPTLTKQVLERIEQIGNLPPDPQRESRPEIDPPSDLVFPLCGAFLQLDGTWATEFEVRELNGRDEEYLGRIKQRGRILIALIERGLVRVGNESLHGVKAEDVIDRLLAGDWETVLLAIRIASFGDEYSADLVCQSCGQEYRYTVDLRAVARDTMYPEDMQFPVTGKNGTEYEVTAAYGSVQRGILLAKEETSLAEIATLTLQECVISINGIPPLPGSVLNMPIADRRKIIAEIDRRRVGPRLEEVTTKCPTCDREQPTPLNVIALFQG